MYGRIFKTLIALVIAGNNCMAQTPLKPGYIVTNRNDTLQVQIDDREWVKNPSSLKATKDGSETSYSIQDLQAFGITAGDVYRRFTVTMSLEAASVDRAQREFTNDSTTQTVWLRRVYQGGSSLWVYENDARKWFFHVPEGSAKPVELRYKVRITEQRFYEVFEFRQYLTTLAMAAGKSNQLSARIRNTTYTEADLTGFFSKLEETEAPKSAGKKRLWFEAGVGVVPASYNNSTNNTASYLNEASFDNNLQIMPRVGIQIGGRRGRGNLLGQIHAGYRAVEVNGSSLNNSTDPFRPYSLFYYQASYIQLQARLAFATSEAQNLRFYGAVGLDANFLLSKSRHEAIVFQGSNSTTPLYTVQDEPNYGTTFGSPMVAAGIMHRWFRVELGYSLPANMLQGDGALKIQGLGISAYLRLEAKGK